MGFHLVNALAQVGFRYVRGAGNHDNGGLQRGAVSAQVQYLGFQFQDGCGELFGGFGAHFATLIAPRGKGNPDMPTELNKPVSRETAKVVSGRNVIVTLAPCGAQSEARIGLRLKGKRTQYVCTLSDLYRMAALWHGQKEAAARKMARKNGIPWAKAKKLFLDQNSL